MTSDFDFWWLVLIFWLDYGWLVLLIVIGYVVFRRRVYMLLCAFLIIVFVNGLIISGVCLEVCLGGCCLRLRVVIVI